MGTNYHNEVLRKARVLERKAQANLQVCYSLEQSPEDVQRSIDVLNDIKQRAAYEEARANGPSNQVYSSTGDNYNRAGVYENRQKHDHSRNGPIRDDSCRIINQQMNMLLGPKPNYLHTHWKG